MYFSCSINNPNPGDIDTYSAISNDGINYTFDSLPRFNSATYNAIDPSVIDFNNTWYYSSNTGVTSNGNHRATSGDGLNFTTQAMLPYDGSHVWLGNYMKDGAARRFYGTGMYAWTNYTTDMVNWSGYINTNVMGVDPAVVKNNSGTYIMIFTGPPNTSGIAENSVAGNISVFPVPASGFLNVNFENATFSSENNYTMKISDVNGKMMKQISLTSEKSAIDLHEFSSGIYFYSIERNAEMVKRGKLIVE